MQAWIDQINEARAAGRTLAIQGHGSKVRAFGELSADGVLDTTGFSGIVSYQPEELVVTVRSGTSLNELEQALKENGQQLAFEPPRLEGRGTVGGTVASGLSGPARPWCGATRDAVLGVRLINGLGELLTFGGQVMKNVAGYDVSRLQAGALGAFAVLCEVSLRVMPIPKAQVCASRAVAEEEAISTMRGWCRQPLPLTGLCYSEGVLRWRLAGHADAVADAQRKLGGEADDAGFWEALRDWSLPQQNFEQAARRVCPPGDPIETTDKLIDWAGGIRWTDQAVAGAHRLATTPALGRAEYALAVRLKQAFDPSGIFNPEVLRANEPS